MEIEKPLPRSVVPIPPSERFLPVIMAEPWLQVESTPHTLLEGPAFDREENLYITSVFQGRIIRINSDKRMTIIFNDLNYQPTGLAFHRDGRLFVVCVSGQMMILDAAEGNVKEITVRYKGKPMSPNDLVFDERGNVYITDVSGTPVDPAGGVYRLSADLSEVCPIMENLVTANGISLAPPGTAVPSPFVVPYEFWVAESALNRILHLKLQEDGITPGHPPAVVAYYCAGDFGPDSNAVDAEGNLYQSLVGQGRFLVLSKTGIPVAQILVPGRDEGKSILTTNAAFKPGTNQGFITTGGPDGGWIYTFRGLARAPKLFSHQ